MIEEPWLGRGREHAPGCATLALVSSCLADSCLRHRDAVLHNFYAGGAPVGPLARVREKIIRPRNGDARAADCRPRPQRNDSGWPFGKPRDVLGTLVTLEWERPHAEDRRPSPVARLATFILPGSGAGVIDVRRGSHAPRAAGRRRARPGPSECSPRAAAEGPCCSAVRSANGAPCRGLMWPTPGSRPPRRGSRRPCPSIGEQSNAVVRTGMSRASMPSGLDGWHGLAMRRRAKDECDG
jgi:hypothetical protein